MKRDILEGTNCCVIIPTYNNAQTLGLVITEILEFTQHIVVVNDGSTDGTSEILGTYTNIEVVSYSRNKGKGFALRTGFNTALNRGYHYAITIDSDGQHKAADLYRFVEKLNDNPNSLIIGARNLTQDNVPAKSNFGNKFSNFWVKAETGYVLPDTQSGYRLYPIKALSSLSFFSMKFEFEIEVLAKAAWSGVELTYVPVDVYYAPKEERISHFRPFKDFLRISVVNTILITLAFIYYWPRNIIRKFRQKSFRQLVKDEILASKETNYKIAAAIGFGIFMGIMPVWGYQLLIGFFLAHLLKLNKTLFFIFANISLPPMIPFILYLSYITGGFVLNQGGWQLPIPQEVTLDFVWQNLEQYLVGAVIFATAAGLVVAATSYILLTVFRKGR
jgi:glycosyltransferase involved in cell wall biosynthesis